MWELFDYVDSRGKNDFLAWLNGLQKQDRARMQNKLDMLEEHGPNLPATLFSDIPNRKIKKIRVTGKLSLRPLLCIGPINNDREFTMLKGAEEYDRKFKPPDAVDIAFSRRGEVIADPFNRRCPRGKEP